MRHTRSQRRLTRPAVVLACMTALLSGCVTVPHPRDVQPERPSVATHAGTVAPGYAEIEAGVEHDRIDRDTHATLVPLTFKFGLAERVQFGVQAPFAREPGAPFGAGDVALGIKWRVSEHNAWMGDVALLPQVKAPTGGARGTGSTDASLLLIDSHTVDGVSLDLNVGETWHGSPDHSHPGTVPAVSSLWTVSAGIPIHGALGSALELFGYPGTHGAGSAAPIVALLVGPTWLVRPSLALDVGLIEPIAGAQPRAIYAGAVTSLGKVPGVHLHTRQ